MKHLHIKANVYHCSYYKLKLTLEAEDKNQLEAAYKCLDVLNIADGVKG